MSDSMQLIEGIRRRASDAPRAIAYLEAASGKTLSYRELIDRADAVARQIVDAVDVDDVVMLRCGNVIEFPIWYLAILIRGASVFPVSIELKQEEIESLARESNACAIVDGNALLPLPVSRERAGERVLPNDETPHDENASTRGPLSPTLSPSTGRGSIGAAMLLASSGTTGVPKIVRRSVRSLDAVAAAMVDAIDFRATDTVLASVPLSHSYGVEHGLLAPLWAGSSVKLCAGMDLPTVARELRGGATIFPAVPSIFEMLASLTDSSLTMPKLRRAYSAGGPLPIAVAERFEARFGVRIGQVYGMTEIGSVTYSPSPASVGRAMRDVSIRVLSFDRQRAAQPIDQEGEIAVRAASMFDGYLHGDTPLIDGHFPTGDVGRIDEGGNLTLTGRVRLLIDTGGLKINPIEVERVIGLHPGVLECVVLPLQQSETVQRLRAVIVPRDGATPPAGESIRAFVRKRLASYKVPRVIEYRSSLPRTASGKVMRHMLETP